MTARRTSLLLLLLQFLLFWRRHEAMILPVFTKGTLRQIKEYDLYYIGENITLHCQKNSNFLGKVSFRDGNTEVLDKFVELTGPRDARMDKPVTAEDTAVTQYQCLDGGETVPLIGLTSDIYSDYRPRKATGMQVVWLNKTDLHISWEFGDVHYKNAHLPTVIKVTMDWRTDVDNEWTWKKCLERLQSNQTCKITNFTEKNATLHVRVNITNMKRRDSAVHEFPGVLMVDHAKPRPVTSVTVRSLSSRSAEVKVTTDQPELNYTITYYPAGQGLGCRDGGMVSQMVTGMTSNNTWQVSGLHPSYAYCFDVQARFEQGYISDLPATGTTLQMPEDAPESAPIIPPSGYYLDDSRCHPDVADSAAVTAYIYFQDIPPEDQNGVIKNYTAEVSSLPTVYTLGTEVQSRTLTLDGLPCGDRFEVTVVGSTEAGVSPTASVTLFPSHQDLLQTVRQMKLRMRMMNAQGGIRAEWIPPPSSSGLSLFLYYCQPRSAGNPQCQDAVKYTEVNASDGQLVLKGATAAMKFGSAVVTENETSGIQFSNCLYDPSADAGHPPRNLKVYGHTGVLAVLWNVWRCDAMKRVITLNYIIQVCQVHGDCHTYIVDADSSSYTVKGLELDRDYIVRIRANTTSEPDSLTPFSDPVQVTLLSGVKSMPLGGIVSIAIAVLVIVVGLAFVSFRIIRDKIRNAEYKFKPSIIPASWQTSAEESDRGDQVLGISTVSKSDTGIINDAHQPHSREAVSVSLDSGNGEARNTTDGAGHDSLVTSPAWEDSWKVLIDQARANDCAAVATDSLAMDPPGWITSLGNAVGMPAERVSSSFVSGVTPIVTAANEERSSAVQEEPHADHAHGMLHTSKMISGYTKCCMVPSPSADDPTETLTPRFAQQPGNSCDIILSGDDLVGGEIDTSDDDGDSVNGNEVGGGDISWGYEGDVGGTVVIRADVSMDDDIEGVNGGTSGSDGGNGGKDISDDDNNGRDIGDGDINDGAISHNDVIGSIRICNSNDNDINDNTNGINIGVGRMNCDGLSDDDVNGSNISDGDINDDDGRDKGGIVARGMSLRDSCTPHASVSVGDDVMEPRYISVPFPLADLNPVSHDGSETKIPTATSTTGACNSLPWLNADGVHIGCNTGKGIIGTQSNPTVQNTDGMDFVKDEGVVALQDSCTLQNTDAEDVVKEEGEEIVALQDSCTLQNTDAEDVVKEEGEEIAALQDSCTLQNTDAEDIVKDEGEGIVALQDSYTLLNTDGVFVGDDEGEPKCDRARFDSGYSSPPLCNGFSPKFLSMSDADELSS